MSWHPGGLYHNVAGIPATAGTAAGIDIRIPPATAGPGPQDPVDLRRRDLAAETVAGPLRPAHPDAPLQRPADRCHPPTAASVSIPSAPTSTTATTRPRSTALPTPISSPAQFYDYRWPMQLAGYDSINTDASDPRAASPCSPGEVNDFQSHHHEPEPKTCDRTAPSRSRVTGARP